jgi:5'-3' exonuclease
VYTSLLDLVDFLATPLLDLLPSSPAMGVHGLTPFLRASFPSTLSAPSLASLAHQTLLIDSSVLTSKFHYSRSNTHLDPLTRIEVNWLYFLKSLLKHGIQPVLILDGETRIEGKAREIQRREDVRTVMKDRAEVERARGEMWEGLRDGNEFEGGDVGERVGESRSSRMLTADSQRLFEAWRISRDGAEIQEVQVDIVQRVEVDPTLIFPPTPVHITSDSLDTPTVPAASLDEAMARTTLEEPSQEDDLPPPLPLPTLTSLIERSQAISTRYTTRTTPPPSSWSPLLISICETLEIPHYQPPPSFPFEAEAICAFLQKNKKGHWVVSEDLDVVVCGGKLLRGFPIKYSFPTSEGEEGNGDGLIGIDPVEVKEAMEMTQDQFLEFALLCGTDFTSRIKGVGPKTAFKLLGKWATIGGIIEGQEKYKVEDVETYLKEVEGAKSIFGTEPSEAGDEGFETFLNTLPDVTSVVEPVVGFEWRDEMIEGRLEELLSQEEELPEERMEEELVFPSPSEYAVEEASYEEYSTEAKEKMKRQMEDDERYEDEQEAAWGFVNPEGTFKRYDELQGGGSEGKKGGKEE